MKKLFHLAMAMMLALTPVAAQAAQQSVDPDKLPGRGVYSTRDATSLSLKRADQNFTDVYGSMLLLQGRAPAPALRFATTRGEYPQNTTTATSTTLQIEAQKVVYLGTSDGGWSELRVADTGRVVNSLNVESNVGNDQTVGACLEMTVNGAQAIQRITYGGSNTGTIVNGVAKYLSDPLFPSAFGIRVFPPGAKVIIHYLRKVASAGLLFNRNNAYTPIMAGEQMAFGDGTDSQTCNIGNYATPGGTGGTVNTSARYFGPIGLVGRPVGTPPMAFAIHGDSIDSHGGGGDTIDPTTGASNLWEKAFAAGINGRITPWVNFAYAGTGVTQEVANSTSRRELNDLFSDAGTGAAINDFSSLAATEAQIEAANSTEWGILGSGGATAGSTIQRIHVRNTFPRTSGTSNASANAGYETAGVFRTPYNAFLAAQAASTVVGSPAGMIDVARAVADPSAPDRWAGGAGSTLYTSDWTHPNNTAVALEVPVVQAYFSQFKP